MDSAQIDQIIDKHRGKPGDLIHVLMEIQHENHWLPREVLHRVADMLEIPFSRVLRVVTMYKTFSLTPRGRNEVHVCNGISCHLRGAKKVMEAVQNVTGIKPGETDANWRFSLDTGSCLGSCSLGPEVIVNGRHHARMTPEKVEAVLKEYE
jgi:NADH-quinone oxidoreductase subunit E